MAVAVPKRIASGIINALKGGVVPRTGLGYIAVGRTAEINALLHDVDITEEGGAFFRFIVGRYGSGKSFMLQTMRQHLMDRGFVTADADLSPERRLMGTKGQGLATYRELMRNMSVRTKPDGGALPLILEKWITAVRTDVVSEGTSPDSPFFDAAVEKKIYTKADAIVFTAEGAYDYIKGQHWENEVPRSKVYYINNGVDLELFDYNKENFRVEDTDLDDPGIFKVVYTGSIRQVNNLGLLLDAAKEVKDERVRFLIWGDGDEKAALEQRLQEENIGNVTFKGRVEKRFVPSIVSRSDLNYIDPFPDHVAKYGISSNKLFEYFAAGKPILVQARERYNPVKTYHAGICLHSLTATDLAAQIDAFAQMDEAGYRSYCAGASAAAKEFDFKKLTAMLLDAIEGTAKE